MKSDYYIERMRDIENQLRAEGSRTKYVSKYPRAYGELTIVAKQLIAELRCSEKEDRNIAEVLRQGSHDNG